MSDSKTMPRVEVTQRIVNIFTMQVCAIADATDEEILAVCNRENRAGTTNGWAVVLRDDDCDGGLGREENKKPVTCSQHPERKHFLVLC